MIFKRSNNLPIKQKMILLVIAGLVVCGSIILFIIIPTVQSMKDIKDRILYHKINYENKVQQEKSASRQMQTLKKIEPQLARLEEAFINRNKELEFITTVEGLAERRGVRQKIDLNLQSETNEGAYAVIPLNLEVTGTYQNVMSYLSDLESSSFYINIYKLSLRNAGEIESARAEFDSLGSPSPETGVISGVQLDIQAHTYWK